MIWSTTVNWVKNIFITNKKKIFNDGDLIFIIGIKSLLLWWSRFFFYSLFNFEQFLLTCHARNTIMITLNFGKPAPRLTSAFTSSLLQNSTFTHPLLVSTTKTSDWVDEPDVFLLISSFRTSLLAKSLILHH